jgi:hypothetical protein
VKESEGGRERQSGNRYLVLVMMMMVEGEERAKRSHGVIDKESWEAISTTMS